MKKGELLNKMLVLAVTRHAGQYDKGGNPYILHCLKVMHYLKSDDEELNCIALGHDLIEDTNVTVAEMKWAPRETHSENPGTPGFSNQIHRLNAGTAGGGSAHTGRWICGGYFEPPANLQ